MSCSELVWAYRIADIRVEVDDDHRENSFPHRSGGRFSVGIRYVHRHEGKA